MGINIIRLSSAASTNSYIRSMNPLPQEDTLVIAEEQTAGRGQRGNTWEAEPGKNLTFSLLYHPKQLPAAEQFLLSCAISLAVTDFIAGYIPAGMGKVSVKWPNDIYVDNSKICGILIENSLEGKYISWSIIGVGVNINQTVFTSDAPNPVSLAGITGKEYSLDAMLSKLTAGTEHYLGLLESGVTRPAILAEYKSRLWRAGLLRPFRTPDGEEFHATVTDVAPDGQLTLTLTDGTLRRFYFKEVQFVM